MGLQDEVDVVFASHFEAARQENRILFLAVWGHQAEHHYLWRVLCSGDGFDVIRDLVNPLFADETVKPAVEDLVDG